MATRYSLVSERDAERRRIALPEDAPLTIGRSRENGLVLAHTLVSSIHAEIAVGEDGPVLRDLGSRNGTFVNGNRVEGDAPLRPGDRIVIGGKSFILESERSSATSVTLLDDGEGEQQVFASIDTSASGIDDEQLRRESFRALARAHRNLAVLHEMGGLLLEAKDESGICARALDLVFDMLHAERACVILRTEDGGLDTSIARTRANDGGGVPVSRTILGKTLEQGLSLLTSDATSDERFRAGHSVIVQGIHAAMCAPIRGKRSVLGALYVDTRLKTGAFATEDLELLTTLGIQAGFAIENLRLLRENLRAERLAAVGAVVAGLGHDIRNILTALSGGAYMMDHFVGEIGDENLAEAWKIVHDSTETITDLVNDMVSYSKERTPDRQPMDPNRVVDVVATRFSARAKERGAVLSVETDPAVPAIEAERAGIDRVLSNLVANALDALPAGGGRVTLRTRATGGEVRMEVTDDGSGIDPDHRERIFDLLFSTKGSKGTGFGLAISKKIIEEHGGRIAVDSEVGAGTTFQITLPRS